MFWRICFGFLASFIAAGNILIICIFFKLRRRKRSSFLLIGLGVADLLVGGLAIPLFIAGYETSSLTTVFVFERVDINTLAVISLERMFAIGWPLKVKLGNTLFIITGASLLTWLPFQILNLSASLHMNANIPHMQLMTLIVKALQYSNSFVNVIIYPLRIPERRKRSTFLLIGLGVADLLVGGLAIPLLIATYKSASITVWRVFDLVDMFTSTSSIYALAVISVERMFAIGWPLRHRTANFRVYICAIALPWIIAAIFAITFFVFANFIFMTRDSVIYPIVLLPATPLLIMCVAYYVIWRKQKSTICNQNNIIREVKLAKTLFLITGASVFTWLPFQILNLLAYLQITANFSHMLLMVLIIRVLQYSNSFVNVIIYPLRIPEFKNYLLHLLRC
ncbi:unnamed protein product, partial [Pocillopora meandrina]